MKKWILGLLLLTPSIAMASQIDGRFIKDTTVTPAKLDRAYLPEGGGTMTGALDMGSHQINHLTDPSISTDAASKNYVDTQIATVTPKTWLHEILALSGTDITNQYKDSSQQCVASSEMVYILGLKGSVGADYTLSVVGGKTRVSFVATTGWGTGSQQALTSADALDFQCQY